LIRPIPPFTPRKQHLAGNSFSGSTARDSFVIQKLNFMRKFGLFLISFLVAASGFGQQISGNVKDQESKGLTGSTISLLNAKDSSVVKLALSNNEGRFSFNGIKAGRYLVSVSHIGFKPGYSTSFEYSASSQTNVP